MEYKSTLWQLETPKKGEQGELSSPRSDKCEQRHFQHVLSAPTKKRCRAHCRVIILTTFYEEVSKQSPTLSSELRVVLQQLVELYAAYWTLEKFKDFLLYTTVSSKDAEILQLWYEELLAKIRPNAVGLVDSFDIIDEVLQSSIGAYDGRAYERLMEEAFKSPLNSVDVHPSYHKYIKPFVLAKI